MEITNFFKHIYDELIDFLGDIKLFFTDIFSSIHHFLNKFMSDGVITVFAIAIIAFLVILIFRSISDRD